MLQRTPFRQLSRLYASILALGRLPEVATEIGQALTQASERSAAAARELAAQYKSPAPPSTAPAEAISPAPPLLDRFRGDLLKKLDDRLLCIDVGARYGADNALLSLRERAKVLCFEPDDAECARLQANFSPDVVEYVPLALSSDGRDLDLILTLEPACSSIYEPVKALYQRYPGLAVMAPERVAKVPSVRLDSYLEGRGLRKPDLLKLDTQGSEFDILQGSINSLQAACMLEVEVEFNPLYEGQPLFADIDRFMRANGFSLWRIPMMVHYHPERFEAASTALQSESVPPNRLFSMSPGNGQLFWGNAHYVRTEFLATDSRAVPAELARRAAAIASAYGYWDLALTVLEKTNDTAFEASTLRGLLSLS
jgi:FkbM family methyltransferase